MEMITVLALCTLDLMVVPYVTPSRQGYNSKELEEDFRLSVLVSQRHTRSQCLGKLMLKGPIVKFDIGFTVVSIHKLRRATTSINLIHCLDRSFTDVTLRNDH